VNAETTLKDYPDLSLMIKTSTSLTGNTDFSTTLGKLDYKGKYEGDGSWSLTSAPATITGNTSAAGELDYQYQLPSFMINFASQGQLSFDQVSGYGNGKRDDYFWLGDQWIKAEEVTFNDLLSNEQMVLNQFSFKSGIQQDATGSRLNLNQVIKTGAVTTSLGNLNKFDMDFSILNLDKISMTKIMSEAEKAKFSETKQINQAEIVGALDQLVKQGFSVVLDRLNFGLKEGQVQTSVKLTLPEGIEAVTMNPQQLVQKLEGEIHATVPVSLIDKDPDLRKGIDELIVMEIVQQKGDNYVTNSTIKDGNLIFESGEKMPLASSLMMLMYLSR
jgi:uncharacterized protein YdgA (DUF945 family)